MLSLYILLSVLTVLVVHYVRKFIKWREFFVNLPGETSFSWAWGTLHKYPGSNDAGLEYSKEMMRKCKYFHRHWFGPFQPFISLYHPDALKQVFKSSAPKSRGRLFKSPYQMLMPWLGQGLLISNGGHWARNRRLLTPAFHFDILKPYVNVYNTCSDIVVEKVSQLMKSGEAFDLFPLINLQTLDIILRCSFSYVSDCQTSPHQSEYLTSLNELAKLFTKRTLTPGYFVDAIYNLSSEGRAFAKHCHVVHRIAEEVIRSRKQQLEEQSGGESRKKVRDFLDTLILARDDTGKGLDPKEIRDEVDNFMFAGHDTTASGTAFTLSFLSRYQKYQERVFQEVSEVLGDREHFEWADLSKLTFTHMCIKEGLRMSGTVPTVARTLSEDVVINGYTIPAGCDVQLEIYLLHHNPHVWDKPDEYDPDRFQPDKQAKMDPFQFTPFSAGSRNCIGQSFAMNEMKVTIGKLIKKYELTADPTHKVTHANLGVMKPGDGIKVFAKLRN